MNKTKTIIVAFLLVASLLVSIVGIAGAAGSQMWNLRSHDPGVAGAQHQMQKNTGYGPASYVVVAAGVVKIWVSDEVAEVDVGFGIAEWTGLLDFTGGMAGKQISAQEQ